jgi:purine-binding chemotaxis protein CheW
MAALARVRGEKRAVRRAGEAGKRTEYLAFVLAGETYAVQIAHVAEILRPPPFTEVPRAPRTVLGVISVRGRLVTVLDLRRRFALPEAPVDRKTRVLLSEAGAGEQIGLLVDEVQQVWRLAAEEIEPANVLGGDQPAHIAGIGRPTDGEGTILILLELRPILEQT